MIKSVKPSGRGGKRLRAGRLSTWRTRHFKTIRVPVSSADQLLEIARYLDGQTSFPRKFYSFEDEDSEDFDCQKAIEVSHVYYCAGYLTYQNNLLRAEVESLKAELKFAQKRRLRLV